MILESLGIYQNTDIALFLLFYNSEGKENNNLLQKIYEEYGFKILENDATNIKGLIHNG
ncbi:hypothetical protein [Poseidonibacter ostreae]|uniref:hypothetical protein n=1 Tax=Poseidonibacter ostreae TaxID=2654171 RepID=UPI00186ADCFB|nr:hypothetical protein [Poseidonibacter ostreae]